MARQNECLEYIRENPGCTTPQIVAHFHPDPTAARNANAGITQRCNKLIDWGLVRKIGNPKGTRWWPL